MGQPSPDPERVERVAGGGAAYGSNTGSFLQQREAVAGQVGCPELGGLTVLQGGPSQPPGLVA